MNVFKNGLLTGLILQLAIGPVFFFIVNLALQRTMADGFAGVVAVTLVDYFYITLALMGVGKVLEKKKIKKIFGIISSSVLIMLGILTINSALSSNTITTTLVSSSDLISSFTSTFLLTISSPMGIIFWTSIFTSKAMEFNYSKRELFIFGLSTGLATLLFMGSAVILFSYVKESIPLLLIKLLNIFVGCVLIGYGGTRLLKAVVKK